MGGCYAAVGTSGPITVPPEATQTCESHCASIGTSLDAVVVMANNVGCVCRPAKPKETAASSNGAVAGGMAALIMEEEERRRQEEQARMRR